MADLQNVLLAMPKTLELGTSGDSSMEVLDVAREAEVREEMQRHRSGDDSLCDGNAELYGIRLAIVRSAGKIHGYSG